MMPVQAQADAEAAATARWALKKAVPYSLPYGDIIMWSSENAGTIDMTAEVKLWTRAGLVRVNLGRNIDVRRIDYLIANCVLNSH